LLNRYFIHADYTFQPPLLYLKRAAPTETAGSQDSGLILA
jgi:hypothetical protein